MINRLISVYPINKTVYHRLPFTGRLNGRLIRLGEHIILVRTSMLHGAHYYYEVMLIICS